MLKIAFIIISGIFVPCVLRPRRVALLDPGIGVLEVDAVAGFVPERPDDDRRMVLVPLDHAGDPVEVGRAPGGIFGQALLAVAHAVRFDVGLVDDVEAVLVAELVPARVVRVVAGPDGVDVRTLHDLDIAPHGLLGDDVGREGIVLMAIDALEQNGCAVDEELSVLDLGGPEADPGGDGFEGLP